MSTKREYDLRVMTNQHEIGAMKLLKNTFKMGNEFWKWKYTLNPDFDPSFAVVAVDNNEVVGCAFWLPRNLKISESTSVRVTLGADLAVDANHQGQGIGTTLIASENKILEKKKFVISYGFVQPDLVQHIHGPQLGLAAIPTSTTVYKKYFDCSKIREKIQSVNEKTSSAYKTTEKPKNLDMKVSFVLQGMPSFAIKIKSNQVYIDESDLENADLKFQGDLTTLNHVSSKKGTKKAFALIKALFMRKIKISGNLHGILKLYTIFKLLRQLIV